MTGDVDGSCIFVTPQHVNSDLLFNFYVQICEYIFFVVMTIEMTLKILANGLIFTPNALLKDFGGFLDFFIYIVSSQLSIRISHAV
ncbi:Sodium leak channel non selective protein [Fasciola gigantica]|uniref:Sodium leak channel non selective protein n=1 Tax=Fasciola gigantica TaxID=46835 RepID=A0A504YVD1_FASGI|nr:Sodium leak channel non selective protein [Fasciola gigantica]